MDLDKRNLDGKQRIAHCDAGVCECPGIQQYVIGPVVFRLLNTIDDLVFGIALESGQVVAVLRCEGIESGLHVGQARGAIDAGFAGAEQIEIGTV